VDWTDWYELHGHVKDFDKVNHDVGGNLLRWFRSYLTNRKQRVTLLGARSNPLSVIPGVPKGSILDPVLFLLYVNDLPSTVKSSCNVRG
jgi:hypothetical protein